MNNRSLIFLFALILTSIAPLAKAEDPYRAFSFKHPDCQTRVPKKDHFLQELFLETLEGRGYSPQEITKSDPLRKGEIYMSYQQTHPAGIIFKSCLVQLSLKVAKINGGSENDDVLYEHQVLRELPRVTFKGKERCRRALKDSFVHIPYCLKPQAP
jgi:hypothetical protein